MFNTCKYYFTRESKISKKLFSFPFVFVVYISILFYFITHTNTAPPLLALGGLLAFAR